MDDSVPEPPDTSIIIPLPPPDQPVPPGQLLREAEEQRIPPTQSPEAERREEPAKE